MWYLYISENPNGAYYTGITTNLKRHFKKHRIGKCGQYTSRNRPQKLVYTETFPDRIQAEHREQQIKHWSRAKKTALIEGNFDK
jgi:predicted GIY-YIG superfamily endonuclease